MTSAVSSHPRFARPLRTVASFAFFLGFLCPSPVTGVSGTHGAEREHASSTQPNATNPIPASLCYVAIDATSFTAPVGFPTAGPGPSYVATGDLDGDGKPDIVATNEMNDNLSTLRNTSTPGSITTASFSIDPPVAAGIQPRGVAIGDIDGDLQPDVVYVSYGSNEMSVRINSSTLGSISLDPPASFATALQPMVVALSDLDGDGTLDVVVGHYGASYVSVFRNTSTMASPSFAPRVDLPGGVTRGIVCADIDGDGKNDIVATNLVTHTVDVYRNTGATGVILFDAPVSILVGDGPLGVDVGDLDGDGKPDIAVGRRLVSEVSVIPNLSTSGTLTFGTPAAFATGAEPRGVVIHDLNADGKADISVATFVGNSVSVLENTSGGWGSFSFAPRVDFAVGQAPWGLDATDLDLDGMPDLTVACSASSEAEVLHNEIDAACASLSGTVFFDENGDGVHGALEPGLQNWSIMLTGPVSATGGTQPSGAYAFGNIPAGTYTVSEINPSPWVQTVPGGPETYTIVVHGGDNIINLDFGNWIPTCVTPPAGMVAWWPFNESYGTTVHDVSGGTWNNGLMVNAPTHTPGLVGNALQFDGVDDYVTVGDDSEINFPNGQFSMDCWFRMGDWTKPEYALIDKRTALTWPFSGYSLALVQSQQQLGYFDIEFTIADGSTQVTVSTGDMIVSGDGNWHHVAAVADASLGSARVYLDGLLRGAGSGLTIGSTENSAPLRIGEFSAATLPVSPFIGKIDEVELFTTTLTDTEVLALWGALSHGKCMATGVGGNSAPQLAMLYPNVPNPFNPTTTLRYDVPAGGANVTLRVYDTSGRRVATLVDRHERAGRHAVVWTGRDEAGRTLASGVYFAELRSGDVKQTRKMVLLK